MSTVSFCSTVNFYSYKNSYHKKDSGHTVAQLVETLRYKPEGRGFDYG
jgi:hypothetical protein